MIVKPGAAEHYAAHPPETLAAALVFGPDQGLVRERAESLTKSVVPELRDPFRVAEFEEEALSSDPALLWDEAAAISMLGGRRVIRVRNAGNVLAKHFERYLEEPPGDALIVVEAGDLAKGASLRRVFEGADNAAALGCYPDSSSNLDDVIRAALKAEGLSIEPQALSDLVSRLGSDRGVTRSELEKLILYVGDEKTVTIDHIRATMGNESDLRMDECCDAAGAGNFKALDTALARLWMSGTSPVAVLRLALGHFQRLALVRGEYDNGGDMQSSMRKLRPPIHFRRANSFKAQISNWSEAKLEDAQSLLYEAEALTKTTGVPAEAACGRALFSVAALARSRRH
ncbi:MAG: DNA polymerase III subunit delta [Alphaproteobacteria bacterium]|jgi:DNA polymerase-3 subunit delta